MGSRLGRTQAKAVMAELIDIRAHITRLIDELAADDNPTVTRQRDYDMPTPDPDEIAERWGVEEPPDDGPVPTWFRERFQQEPE